MFKKIAFALLAAAVLALPFSATALAADEIPQGVRIRGEVAAVDVAGSEFLVKTSSGETLTFAVSQETSFRGKAQSLADLQAGWKVGVGAREDETGTLWAVLVISGDPEDFIQARGTVTDVNLSAGKFTIQKPDGDKTTFFVDQNTRYGGQAGSLEDIQEGWQAGVLAKEANPGKLLAVGVVAGDAPHLLKVKGEVTAVNASAGSFSIQTNDGRSLSFQVDHKTRYQGQLSSLEEMQVGWIAGVAAKETEGEGLLAVLVIAGTRPEGIRAQGTIKTVNPGANKFQLEKADGSVLTVYVDGSTRYRGQVESFADLEKGMRAAFGGIVDQEGKIVARVVIAGNPRSDRPQGERPEGIRPEGERPLPDPDLPLTDPLSYPES